MSYRNRTRGTRVTLLNACLVGAVAFSSVAGAQEDAVDSVSVTLVGRDATIGELARLLVEWNAKLSVRRMQHISAADILGSNGTGMLRIWVLMVPGWGAKIYLSDPSSKRYLRREVPLAAGLDESGREMLAQVIATAANGFVERRESSSVAEIESSLREDGSSMLRYAEPLRWYGRLALHGTVTTHNRTSVSSDTPSWHAYSGAFYAVRAVSADQFAHGPGMMLGVAQTGTIWRWQTALEAQYELPMRIVTSEATLQLRTWSAGVNIACDSCSHTAGLPVVVPNPSDESPLHGRSNARREGSGKSKCVRSRKPQGDLRTIRRRATHCVVSAFRRSRGAPTP